MLSLFQVYSKMIQVSYIYIIHTHVYMHVSYIYIIHTSMHTYIFFFRFFSIIAYYKILNIVPCALQ